MFRKKLVTSIIALTMITGLFAGCSSSQDTSSTDTSTSEATTTDTSSTQASTSTEDTSIEPTEITFWHGMTGEQEETLQELTDEFNDENEYGITVTLVGQGSYSDLSTKLTANAAAGTLPDISQAYNSWVIPYVDQVVHLDDFVANDFDDYDDIVEGYRDEVSQLGFISALPFNKSTYVYFYNKTLFDELGLEAPETWDDVEQIGKVFKEEKDMYSIGVDDLGGFLEASLHQNGTDYISEEGALFDNEAGEEAVDYVLDLYRNGYARLVGDDQYFSGPLSNQLIGAYIGSSTGVSFLDTSSGWELGVASLPGNVEDAANQGGTDIFMFAQDTNKQKAAWEYMKFLTSEESTTTWAINTGYLPIRTSAYESDEYQEFMASDATATAAYAQSDSFFSTPTFDEVADIQSAVKDELEALILDGTDNETAFDDLIETINDEID